MQILWLTLAQTGRQKAETREISQVVSRGFAKVRHEKAMAQI